MSAVHKLQRRRQAADLKAHAALKLGTKVSDLLPVATNSGDGPLLLLIRSRSSRREFTFQDIGALQVYGVPKASSRRSKSEQLGLDVSEALFLTEQESTSPAPSALHQLSLHTLTARMLRGLMMSAASTTVFSLLEQHRSLHILH